MITLLIGENSFEIERELARLTDGFDGEILRADGSELPIAELPDLLMGASLFSSSRMIIIRNLSANKAIWGVFGDWLDRISDDIYLILVEPKPDKRTATFKQLKEASTVKEFQQWTDRDYIKAEIWTKAEAEKLGLNMDKKCIQALVQRVGLDQWQLISALNKLSLVGDVSIEAIEDVIEANPTENVFNLFETAAKGDMDGVKRMLSNLKLVQDPYALLALLSSQAFQLAAVASASQGDDPAKDFGIHPFVVSKLSAIAKKAGKSGVANIVKVFARADLESKTTATDPWLIIERALIKTANI